LRFFQQLRHEFISCGGPAIARTDPRPGLNANGGIQARIEAFRPLEYLDADGVLFDLAGDPARVFRTMKSRNAESRPRPAK
jgi:hypothetical protein